MLLSIDKALYRSVVVISSLLLSLVSIPVFAHGVAEGDAQYLESVTGRQFIPYMYLGVKHMVTGYHHLLFLAGVIFFLYRLKDVALYVSLFAVGHSITLLVGVEDSPANGTSASMGRMLRDS